MAGMPEHPPRPSGVPSRAGLLQAHAPLRSLAGLLRTFQIPNAGAVRPHRGRAPHPCRTARLRTLRAKNVVSSEFTKTVTTAGEERPWKYRLDATLVPAGPGATPSVSTLFFAERAGGGIQLVGSTDLNAVFEAEQPLIDALFTLTYGPRDPGPITPPPPAQTPAP